MGEHVPSASDNLAYSFLVVAVGIDDVGAAVSRRCEVWPSAGGED